MRLARVALAVAALTVVAVSAGHAQEAGWGIRTRALAILPNADATKGIDAKVKSDLTFEVDITRYFSPLLSAELILATAGHEVELNGTSAGSANILPPTLLLQVHPVRTGSFRPYLGAGVNVTYFYAKSGGLDDLDLGTLRARAGGGGHPHRVARQLQPRPRQVRAHQDQGGEQRHGGHHPHDQPAGDRRGLRLQVLSAGGSWWSRPGVAAPGRWRSHLPPCAGGA